MKAIPRTGNLPELIHSILLPRLVRPVDVTALDAGDAPDAEVHNAFLNADPHLLVVRCLTLDGVSEEDRPVALRALKDIRRRGRGTRSAAERAMNTSGDSSQQSRPLDKTRREHYCKAVAQNYRAMIEAGSVLVRLYDPRLVELYKSHSTR